MSKKVTTVIVVGLLSFKSVGEVDNHGHGLPEHLHTENFVSDDGYRRVISLDSSGSTVTATTDSISYLDSLGCSIDVFLADCVPQPFRDGIPEPREPVHPAEGESAGHTLFTGVASGAISNVVSNTIVNTATSFSLEPSSDGHSGFDFEKPRPNLKLKVSAAPVTRGRQFSLPPRTRSNC